AVIGLDLLNPIFGGETRQESVHKGLEALKEYEPDKILIHDGARPFTSKRVINGILEKMETHPAVIPAIAVEDTIKKYGDGKIEWTIERENLWRAQTPQGFLYQDILSAHSNFKDINFTDDAALDEYAGIPVAIVPGSQNNFKITTEEDYERAKRLVSLRSENVIEETRCGTGYDIHSFRARQASEPHSIRIAGLDILTPPEFNKKIDAHSDGDVAIHAVIDALLGATGQGDIGEHFPPSDSKWKDADSTIMLKHTNHLLRKKGARIINIDLTIICERPKISRYKKQMEESLAMILSIDHDRVNVKAKTNEKMDAVGREEAIVVNAVCSISISVLEK
ncbi:MAG: 2-C-methyl-D-erythritol 4-phosphate cytidylyltransferase, partial [Myxococcota bacterium]